MRWRGVAAVVRSVVAVALSARTDEYVAPLSCCGAHYPSSATLQIPLRPLCLHIQSLRILRPSRACHPRSFREFCRARWTLKSVCFSICRIGNVAGFTFSFWICSHRRIPLWSMRQYSTFYLCLVLFNSFIFEHQRWF